MEAFECHGWQFLCDAQQLLSGRFFAALRYKVPSSSEFAFLVLDNETFDTAHEALEHAKDLAAEWANARKHWLQ